jgi:GTP-binding protein LepA
MVFSGLYPVEGYDYPLLRDALERLQLNDAALVWEPETSAGAGLRIPLRLPRSAAPRDRARAAGARVRPDADRHGTERRLPVVLGQRLRARRDQPERVSRRKIARINEPVVRATVLAPSEYIGAIMEPLPGPARHLARHGLPVRGPRRAALHLAARRDHLRLLRQPEVETRGYASLDYEVEGEQASALVKVDILLQGEGVDAFSSIVHKDKAYAYGVQMTQRCAS